MEAQAKSIGRKTQAKFDAGKINEGQYVKGMKKAQNHFNKAQRLKGKIINTEKICSEKKVHILPVLS